ncbi:MAG: LytTR family DNA-binding domain-containing protein [Mucilaginibacter sp.]
MPVKCLIIDDKPLAIDILEDYILKIPELELVAVTTNPIEGLNILRSTDIDLVFLDIHMPELNGLQFIKIAEKKSKIILTTAYSGYAFDAYENDVVDYLLKPIAFDRFYRAVTKALNAINATDYNALVPNVQLATAYLFVKTEYRIQKINVDEILYVEGLQNYISIQKVNEHIISLLTLKKIEEQLPPNDFIRVHKSYIIALKYISYIERNRIIMGETTIPIGDTYKDNFYKIIDKQTN